MRILLDTHALLWWLFDDAQLSDTARSAIKDPEQAVFLSSASAWEIAAKYRLGKLPEAKAAAEDLPALLRKGRIDVLPVSLEHALAAGSLPGPHRDPFDRMIMAQSRLERMPVVTLDPAFAEHQIDTIW